MHAERNENGSDGVERISVPVDEAIDRLAVDPDYDPGDGPKPCVHTFVDAPFGLIGAHWSVEDARAAMERWGVTESGPAAAATNHGLVVLEDGKRAVFFQTKETRRARR